MARTEIARVLRSGGLAIVSTHQAFRLQEEPNDYFRYTRYGLMSMIADAGMRLQAVESHGGVSAKAGQALITSFTSRLPRQVYPMLRPAVLLWNLIFSALDAVWGDDRDTMNYLIVARK
jgi:hypothetical protein